MGLLIGGLWIFCSVYCFIKRDRRYKSEGIKGIVLGSFFLVFGAIGVLGHFLDNSMLTLTALFLAIALMCIGTMIYAIVHNNACHTPVSAVYVSYNRYSGGKGQYSYAPVFSYFYKGAKYERQALECYSRKKIERDFKEGQKYDIFINSESPQCCVSKKKISPGYILTGGLGFVFLIVYVIIFCDYVSIHL